MTSIKAVVRNGRIETDEPLDLPEGTELVIQVTASAIEGPVWDNSPQGIAAWLRWYDTVEPLIFTVEERAARQADRQSRKEWEKAHFDEYAAKLRAMWK